MEVLPNGFTLEIPEGCFPLSTDSMTLANFARLPRGASVLDLCAGCGTLGLLLCSTNPDCTVTGIELDEPAHAAAMENIRRNNLSHRMSSICDDVKSVSARFSPGSFSCCIANPPYFSGGVPSARTPLARHSGTCRADDLFRAASWAVKYGGDVFVVHKPEMLTALAAAAARYQLEAKELCLVRHRENGPFSMILLRLRKGAKPGLTIREWSLYHADGSPTDLLRQIYHL